MLAVPGNQCLKCHKALNLPATAQYPPLDLAWERLRPEWTLRWLASPDRLISYLEDHDLSMRQCLDHSERQYQGVTPGHQAPVQEEKPAVHLLPR